MKEELMIWLFGFGCGFAIGSTIIFLMLAGKLIKHLEKLL